MIRFVKSLLVIMFMTLCFVIPAEAAEVGNDADFTWKAGFFYYYGGSSGEHSRSMSAWVTPTA